jgi:uncharacterized membrane protein YhaH (DUF805 family)
MDWMLLPYRRYFDFSGRSRRKEYWMFTLFAVIVVALTFPLMFMGSVSAAQAGNGGGPLLWIGSLVLGIFVLASVIPSLAVQVRRFHDQDRSGLLGFIPYVGGIIVLVFMCLEGTRGPNRYGPDPKDPAGAEVFA